MLKIVEEIAQHIISNNDANDLRELFDPKDEWQARELIVEFPRWIRNTYELWNTRHPLTRAWHAGKRLMIDGIDCTKEHPDQVSAAIMRQIKKSLAP